MRTITPNVAAQELLDEGLTKEIVSGMSKEEIFNIIEKRHELMQYRVNQNKYRLSSESNNPLNFISTELIKEKECLSIYFVYGHYSDEGELIYVGRACDGRGYDVVARRKYDHVFFMFKDLLNNKLSLLERVLIIAEFLTMAEAKAMEEDLIKEHNPKYNVQR